ncbi:ATP-binding cassette domain-containing protein [bacterium]|nr:ATP-binding cassette domain-containing protein [bacterium]
MNESRHIVEVSDLTSGYEDIRVLDNVSIHAPSNQITIILGSSGCGKTTLLKHLIRLLQPWSGSIRLFGQEITELDEPEFNTILRKIGVMFQNGALLGSMSVAENVSIPLEQHTDLNDEIIRKLVEIKLDLVELGHAIDRYPSELSGGMRKRAALARAIALDPPLLFGDEPSAGLDPVTSAGLDELILKMRDQLGMTVVLVSHEVASIKRIADHVIFLDRGKVLFCGPLKEARSAGIQKVDDFFSKG